MDVPADSVDTEGLGDILPISDPGRRRMEDSQYFIFRRMSGPARRFGYYVLFEGVSPSYLIPSLDMICSVLDREHTKEALQEFL